VAPTPALKRSLSLGLLTLYGLGTTIGAGIFVLNLHRDSPKAPEKLSM